MDSPLPTKTSSDPTPEPAEPGSYADWKGEVSGADIAAITPSEWQRFVDAFMKRGLRVTIRR
jgi:hypothetical protein